VIAESHTPAQWTRDRGDYVPWQPLGNTKEFIMQKIQHIIGPVFLDATADMDVLFRDFEFGTMVSVSDGSFFAEDSRAAAAWIIESACRTQWIMGSVTIPGAPTECSAYRSELMGLATISLIIKILSCCFPCPPHLLIGCDGKAALQVLKDCKENISANSTNLDIQSVISDIWQSIVTTPVPIHIKGHQDRSGHPLT
jgi:hypothetical protein